MATFSSVQMGSQATPSVRIRPQSRSPARPAAAASPLPALRGHLGGRGPGTCEPASERGDAGPVPAPRRRSPPGPAASARRPPGPPSAAQRVGSRNPVSPLRVPREGEVATAGAALTIAGRQALPRERVRMAQTWSLDFTSISFALCPPFLVLRSSVCSPSFLGSP